MQLWLTRDSTVNQKAFNGAAPFIVFFCNFTKSIKLLWTIERYIYKYIYININIINKFIYI